MSNTTTTLTLEHIRKAAVNAHHGTSFSPEKRGDSIVNDYSAELDSDIEQIVSKGANAEQVERYKKGYEGKLLAYLHSHSNIVSTMIAGPSNFPVRQMEKRNRWADNHYSNFREWRTKVLNAYNRSFAKAKIELAGGELAILKANLVKQIALQATYKEGNKLYRAYRKNPANAAFLSLSTDVKELITSQHSFTLAYLNKSIKHTEQKIKELEAKEARAQEGNKEKAFEGGKIVFNYEIDRLQIIHDTKPNADKIQALKSSGWRWSPRYTCWQRQLTTNAIHNLRYLGIVTN